MNALRYLPMRAWMTLALVTTLCAPVPVAAQSSPSLSVEEAEASVGLDRARRKRIQMTTSILPALPQPPEATHGPVRVTWVEKGLGEVSPSPVRRASGTGLRYELPSRQGTSLAQAPSAAPAAAARN